MSIPLLSLRDAEGMRRAGRAAQGTLAWVGARLAPGVTTAQIDQWVREDTARRGGRPSQLGYKGFPHAVCTSRNEVVCHGMPSPRTVLAVGDIVNVDCTTELDGFHGDTSETFVVGEASADARHVVDVARRCRDAGIAVVREFGGHGIGRRMHQEPSVMHVGPAGRGMRLRAGMAITIEPMVNLGRAAVRVLDDGWTVVTADGALSAQFEHTVIVTRNGCEVTTLPPRV
jgi:methionyl aminopeptidase